MSLPPKRRDSAAGPIALAAAVVEIAQRDAARGNREAAAFVAELQATRPRSLRYADSTPAAAQQPAGEAREAG